MKMRNAVSLKPNPAVRLGVQADRQVNPVDLTVVDRRNSSARAGSSVSSSKDSARGKVEQLAGRRCSGARPARGAQDVGRRRGP